MGTLDNFFVGQKMMGVMKRFYNNNLIIDIGNGALGRLKEGALDIDFEEGKEIPVVIDSITSNVIFLRADSDFISADSVSQNSWFNWMSMPVGHEQITIAMSALVMQIDSFKTDLVAAKKEWSSEKTQHKIAFEAAADKARKACASDCEAYKSTYMHDVSNNQTRLEAGTMIISSCEKFLNKMVNMNSCKKSHSQQLLENV